MGLGSVTIATSALTGASILALVGFCAVVFLFITGGEKFFDRFRGGSFYTVWCISAAAIGLLAVQMLLRR